MDRSDGRAEGPPGGVLLGFDRGGLVWAAAAGTVRLRETRER
ncbi:hypothetical protein AB0I28_22640 [Phytomonospora sp. NPDC050363]